MKNILLFTALIFSLTFMCCDKEDIIIDEQETEEGTIIGRWVLEGFEQTIRYEFTETKRFTIYGEGGGEFPTLEEFMTENPGLTGHDWEYEGDIVVIDLNFGNYSRLIPEFKCDNEVILWKNEAGEEHSTFFREGHDMEACQ